MVRLFKIKINKMISKMIRKMTTKIRKKKCLIRMILTRKRVKKTKSMRNQKSKQKRK